MIQGVGRPMALAQNVRYAPDQKGADSITTANKAMNSRMKSSSTITRQESDQAQKLMKSTLFHAFELVHFSVYLDLYRK